MHRVDPLLVRKIRLVKGILKLEQGKGHRYLNRVLTVELRQWVFRWHGLC